MCGALKALFTLVALRARDIVMAQRRSPYLLHFNVASCRPVRKESEHDVAVDPEMG